MKEISLDYFHLPPQRRYHIYRISKSKIAVPHSHSYYQICYVERGQVQHWIGGQYLTAYYGDAFIVPPGFPHQIVFPDENSMLYSLSFEEEMFHAGFSASNVYRFMTALKLDAAEKKADAVRRKVVLNEDQRYMMYALMESLLRESHSDCPQELTCAASLISAILCILSQAYFMDAERSDRFDMVGEYHRSMRECIDYIDTHFHQPLTLDDLAVRFAVSKSAFCLLFPQFAGMPPKQYITQKRMETAALLVRSTDLPLSEVARRVGYDEFSTFYRNFKRLIGVSPSQYRLERGGEEKESGI